MLDAKLLRESPALVRAAIAKKHLTVDLDAVLAADAAWRAQLQEVEHLRQVQKSANAAMAASSSMAPVSQALAGSAKMVRPTAKPLTMRNGAAALNAATSASVCADWPSSTTPRHGGSRPWMVPAMARQAAGSGSGSSFHQSGRMPRS